MELQKNWLGVAKTFFAASLLFWVGASHSLGDNYEEKDNYEDEVKEKAEKAPAQLKSAVRPMPAKLSKFVKSKSAAIRLGKALFWDMAAGSDGQACASCHFHAGADNRVKNQLSPGLLGNDTTFQRTASGGAGGPNYSLVANDFPFHQYYDPNDRNSGVKFTTNDVSSSQGALGGIFKALPSIDEQDDICDRFPDPIFHVGGVGVRKVEPRNTPSVINAVLNFRNFWDGRANNTFNGVDPFGLRNEGAVVYDKKGEAVQISANRSSLASQAVGPPTSDLEMICNGRKLAQLGRKLLPRRALALQEVHRKDSVLRRLRHESGKGLNLTYSRMIDAAFRQEWQAGTADINGFTQKEANFSLFWGVALQMYQATLVSDKAPYDHFSIHKYDPFEPSEGNQSALTDSQRRGLDVFLGQGKCINCHKGPEFSGAASTLLKKHDDGALVERMLMGDGGVALYDNGFYNIGVTPTQDDIGVGGVDPFGNPLSFTEQFVNNDFVDPIYVEPCRFEVPFVNEDKCHIVPSDLSGERQAVKGAFKTPILRNVELTGPYMHNGSMATLMQVVEFYNRGGNFSNNPELDPDIQPLGLSDQQKNDLVAFLKSLTDPRVRNEQAPFDHPQLFVPNGHPGDENSVTDRGDGLALDDFLEIPAVGRRGRSSEGLPPLAPFLQ